mmetsp:Transcript_7984/g.21667  ORF Transcript_7984/g.21667 Transcript_7984/m.21667 type:complete len:212 (-) Transcript_7984:2525-3160(-)
MWGVLSLVHANHTRPGILDILPTMRPMRPMRLMRPAPLPGARLVRHWPAPTVAIITITACIPLPTSPRRAMNHRHGRCALIPEEHGQRHPHDITVANNHDTFLFQLNSTPLEQLDAPHRRARHKPGSPTPHQRPSNIQRVEPVDILPRIKVFYHILLINMPRQRQLNEHPVDRPVLAHCLHRMPNIRLRARLLQVLDLGDHPDTLTRFPLS